MLVKQIDMAEALRLAGEGMEIKVMAPGDPELGWKGLKPDTLQVMLQGCLFFRDEAAENQESDHVVETVKERPMKERPAVKKKPKKVVDRGKVVALHRAGRSNKWIADDMGLHENTVYRILKELKEEGKLDETTDAEG